MNEPGTGRETAVGIGFPTTHWSAVLSARDGPQPYGEQALERLCRAYWYPLYAYVRRNGHPPTDAEDLTQGFFLHLLNHDFLRYVAPEKGRFRSFLLASLKRFLTGQWRRQQALRRGGPNHSWSLDARQAEWRYLQEPAEVVDPDRLYERRWALILLERVLERLEAEAAASGKQALYQELHPFLTGDRDGRTYAEVALLLGSTEGAVKMTVLRMRERLRALFREEVMSTVASPAEAEDEIQHLLWVLATGEPTVHGEWGGAHRAEPAP